MNRYNKLPLAVDITNLAPNVTREMVESKTPHIEFADKALRGRTCPGADYTGWVEPQTILSDYEISKLKATAKRLSYDADVLLVIGIGGSYLGARAVIEALSDTPERVMYAGQNVSAHYMTDLKAKLKDKRVAVNVVSKSGTTTEPAIAFRLLKDLVPADNAKQMIVATTDANRGALLDLARKEGYETYVVPDDIGGRFSVLSAVGLLPIAYAGINIDAFLKGAADCAKVCKETNPLRNPAYYYAAARNILYRQGFSIEVLAEFEPRLHFISEWWKQLFGESEGKENQGLFTASVDFTTDLHSLGQYIQEGRRFVAESFLIVDEGEPSLVIPFDEDDADGLNYLAEREVSYVNRMAYEATAKAHRDGGVPNLTIHLQKLDPRSLGALIYFFEISCAISGLMLGVNPFNQPGVEAYKNEMFKLLGKPGYDTDSDDKKQQDIVTFK